ncbi:carbohydrate-binding family 9-like protein [uncultured Prevotella sp.]|uniref:carbohydrate-binding family 9-like protein n=1 Tax=uncultured Prevotella sp. TaxID=159272 RepID=UPI0027E3B173|nr:carbohydrate-binding family 9-like protein [uncultured Prevotella sp.]
MNKKILIATLIAASSTAAAFAQDGLLKKYAQRLSTPRNYVCYRTTEKIKIDGKLKEHSWSKAAEPESFVDISGEGFPKPIYDTKARMMWDNNYLYVAAVMEEPNIVAHLTQRDTIIYHDNDFEVFIDPTGDGQNYFEIENNARGVVFDLMLDRAYRSGGNFHIQWDCPGLKLAVSHDGTLNKEKDKDRSWTVEMAIPHKAITRNFTNPLVAGNIWRLNFSRVEWLKKGGPEENWVWTPTGEINMHAPNQWGFLQFSDKNVGGETEEFRCPYNMEAYKLLWAMFYAQLDNREKQGAFTSSTALLGVTDSDLATLPKGSNVNIEATSTLFSISVRVGGTGKTYVVDQNGKFEVK